MKSHNNQTLMLSAAFVAISLMSGCNKTEFAKVAESSLAKTEIPIDLPPSAPVSPVVPPTFSSKVSNGICATDSSTQVLSCLKCDVPQVVQKPQLSKKAQALLDTMALACGIKNKSDHNNFRPTVDMLLNKLNQASEKNYPDSKRTALMEMVIQGLTNPNDNSLRKKMFGGLWYQPPYSDAFEQYFGLTSSEAKSTFCWNGDIMNGVVTDPVGVYSLEWAQCQSASGPFGCVEKPEYIKAQFYRTQLSKSLSLGVTNPYTAPSPDPQKVCHWDKFEGDDLVAAKRQLKQWKSEGRKVSMSIRKNNIGQCGEAIESSITESSVIELATFKCD